MKFFDKSRKKKLLNYVNELTLSTEIELFANFKRVELESKNSSYRTRVEF